MALPYRPGRKGGRPAQGNLGCAGFEVCDLHVSFARWEQGEWSKWASPIGGGAVNGVRSVQLLHFHVRGVQSVPEQISSGDAFVYAGVTAYAGYRCDGPPCP